MVHALRHILDRLLPAADAAGGVAPEAGGAEAPAPSIVHALLQEAQAREAAIARELHDAVGSSLAGVNLLLGTAQAFTREPEALALVRKAQEQVAGITQQVRQISRGMMPAGPERGALLPALEHFAAGLHGLQAVRCIVRSRGDFGDVPPAAGGHLFRIVQEATSNALHHGGAECVRITLARTGNRCRLTVSDNGSGCDPGVLASSRAGIGIQSMQARADEIGGRLALRRRSSGGMKVQVTWGGNAA